MGLPFPHVQAWEGTAQITTQGHRGGYGRKWWKAKTGNDALGAEAVGMGGCA